MTNQRSWAVFVLLGFGSACAPQPSQSQPTPLPQPSAAPSYANNSSERARAPADAALVNDGGVCEPGDREACVCPDQSSSSRRCNEAGTAFGPCDACPKSVRCGTVICEAKRIEMVALTLPACCPANAPNRCGIDVGFVAKNWGYAAGCLELEAPGKPDPSCPSATAPLPNGTSATFEGCRARSGACGYEVSVPGNVNLGCTERPRRLDH